MNKKIAFSLALSFALVVALGSSVYLINTNTQDTRSRAATDIEIKNKSLQNTLTKPYLRLVPRSIVAKKDMVMPVDVVINSSGVVLSEVGVALEFDPTLLLLKEGSIQGADVLPVVDVEQISPGKVFFSVFHGNSSLVEPLIFSKDVVVATVYFQIIGDSGVATIKPISTNDLKTMLYSERDETSGEIIQYIPNLGDAEMLLSSK